MKAVVIASCEARNWFFVTAEMSSPCPSAGIRNVADEHVEREERASERDAEEENGEQHAQRHRRQAQDEIGQDLSREQFGRRHRRRHHRFHRSALPFARDHQRRQKRADESHHDRDRARHEEIAADQLGVEPEPLVYGDDRGAAGRFGAPLKPVQVATTPWA